MRLSRRTFLAGSAAPLLAQRKSSGRKPNILLVLANDLGAWMLGCYGNKEIRTPNLDLLARGGTRFLRHSVCSPAGAPGRASLLTGRTPRQHGLEDAPAKLRNEIMLSDLLAPAGYNCGYIGRWDMGGGEEPQHGFRSWYTLPETMTQRAAQFLEEQKAEAPFFLVASYFLPDAPYDGHPQKYYDQYAKTTFETTGWLPAASNAAQGKEYLKDTVGSLRKCAAAVSALDDQVAALVSVLDKRGLRDDTLVIFTSASGLLGGRHGLWGTGLGSDPVNMYAEAVETPMIWNWPGRVPIEGARPELISSYDLFPTLCEVAGIAPPKDRNLCGRSYLSPATNVPLPRKQPWRNLVFGSLRNTEMARDARFKLVLRNNGAGPNELYDLRADPLERVNRYDNAEFLTVRNSLAALLRQWREKYV